MIFYRVMRTAWSAVADGTRTLLAQLQVPTAGATPIPAEDVEVLQPLGVRAKPVVRARTEAAVFELANGQRVCLLVDKTRDEGAVEPADGEVVMGGLAAPAAVVHIRASGAVEITAAAGQLVVMQGGAQPFVRGTAYADALDDFLDALDTFAHALATAPPATPNAALTVAAVLTAQEVLAPKIAALKAARATYLSTRISGD